MIKYNLLLIVLALNITVSLVGMLPTQTTFFLDDKACVTNKDKLFGKSIFEVLPLDQKGGQLLSLAFSDGMNLRKESSFECVMEGKKCKITLTPYLINQSRYFYSLQCVKLVK